MVILNKKRIVFINFAILCAVFYFGISNDFNSNLKISSIIKDTLLAQTESVSSTPVCNHTIILDAGHGNPDRWCCWN